MLQAPPGGLAEGDAPVHKSILSILAEGQTHLDGIGLAMSVLKQEVEALQTREETL